MAMNSDSYRVGLNSSSRGVIYHDIKDLKVLADEFDDKIKSI